MLSYSIFTRNIASCIFISRVTRVYAPTTLYSARQLFSTEIDIEDDAEVDINETEYAETRSYWRSEIPVPDYAKKHVQSLCKRFSPGKRKESWKQYLSEKRSRDAKKNFMDWGNDSITAGDIMKPLVYDEITSTAHTEYRIAKDFGIVTRILTESLSSIEPQRLLDIGSGSGSASLAAIESYDTIKDIDLVDGSEYMTTIASDLLLSSKKPLSITAHASLIDFIQSKQKPYDLIVMDGFLSDLPSNRARASACIIAWESLQPGGSMMIAEEGDRWGFHLVRCARSLLIRMQTLSELSPIIGDANATPDIEIVAPCMHIKECPLKGNKSSWCHFAQQCQAGPTAAYQSRRKAAEVFSYLVVRKPLNKTVENEKRVRILSTPLKRNRHVIVDVCNENGLAERRTFTKGKLRDDLKRYRLIRKGEWGGVISDYLVCLLQSFDVIVTSSQVTNLINCCLLISI